MNPRFALRSQGWCAISRALALLGLFAWACAAPAWANADLRLPSGIDSTRLKMLKRGEAMKVYVNMVGIGERGSESESRLLFSAQSAAGTRAQIERRFADAVSKSKRFEVFTDSTSGVRDKSDIVVDAMVVAAQQDVEDLSTVLKAVTTVRMSINITDTATGQKLKARTLTATYGGVPGEGTVVRNRTDLASATVQQQLRNDYERALNEAMDTVAGYLERSFRPMGVVQLIEGKEVLLAGGERHGLSPGDKMIVFRTRTSQLGEFNLTGILRVVAALDCQIVNPESSQCAVARDGPGAPIQTGDFAVLSDQSLKLSDD